MLILSHIISYYLLSAIRAILVLASVYYLPIRLFGLFLQISLPHCLSPPLFYFQPPTTAVNNTALRFTVSFFLGASFPPLPLTLTTNNDTLIDGCDDIETVALLAPRMIPKPTVTSTSLIPEIESTPAFQTHGSSRLPKLLSPSASDSPDLAITVPDPTCSSR